MTWIKVKEASLGDSLASSLDGHDHDTVILWLIAVAKRANEKRGRVALLESCVLDDRLAVLGQERNPKKEERRYYRCRHGRS